MSDHATPIDRRSRDKDCFVAVDANARSGSWCEAGAPICADAVCGGICVDLSYDLYNCDCCDQHRVNACSGGECL